MEYITVNEAARRLKVCPLTVRRAIKEGRIEANRFGRLWRIPDSAKLTEEDNDQKKENRSGLLAQS